MHGDSVGRVNYCITNRCIHRLRLSTNIYEFVNPLPDTCCSLITSFRIYVCACLRILCTHTHSYTFFYFFSFCDKNVNGKRNAYVPTAYQIQKHFFRCFADETRCATQVSLNMVSHRIFKIQMYAYLTDGFGEDVGGAEHRYRPMFLFIQIYAFCFS